MTLHVVSGRHGIFRCWFVVYSAAVYVGLLISGYSVWPVEGQFFIYF